MRTVSYSNRLEAVYLCVMKPTILQKRAVPSVRKLVLVIAKTLIISLRRLKKKNWSKLNWRIEFEQSLTNPFVFLWGYAVLFIYSAKLKFCILFMVNLLRLLHPFWNQLWSLEYDWLSSCDLSTNRTTLCSKSHLFPSQWDNFIITHQPFKAYLKKSIKSHGKWKTAFTTFSKPAHHWINKIFVETEIIYIWATVFCDFQIDVTKW